MTVKVWLSGFAIGMLAACKSTAPCPSKDEVAPVAQALKDRTDVETMTKLSKVLDKAAEQEGIVAHKDNSGAIDAGSLAFYQAFGELRDRVDSLASSGGTLTGADLKAAFVKSAMKYGFSEESANKLYEANPRLINREIVESYKAGLGPTTGNKEHHAVFDRALTCSGS